MSYYDREPGITGFDQLRNYQVAGQNAIDMSLNNAGAILAFNAPATAMGIIGASYLALGIGALGVATLAAGPILVGSALSFIATDVAGLVGTAVTIGIFAALIL